LPLASRRAIIGGMDDRIVKGEAVDGVGEKAPTRQSYAFEIDDDTPDYSITSDRRWVRVLARLAAFVFLLLPMAPLMNVTPRPWRVAVMIGVYVAAFAIIYVVGRPAPKARRRRKGASP
jgi:hypothetical protein